MRKEAEPRIQKESIIDKIIPHEKRIAYTCGIRCLLMIYRAYGERVDEETLVSEIQKGAGPPTKDRNSGASSEQLAENARLHGYNVIYSFNVPYEDLIFITQKKKLPVIVSWMAEFEDGTWDHCSLVVYADEEKIKLAETNPAGFITLSREEFERRWVYYDDPYERHWAMVVWKEESIKKL